MSRQKGEIIEHVNNHIFKMLTIFQEESEIVNVEMKPLSSKQK